MLRRLLAAFACSLLLLPAAAGAAVADAGDDRVKELLGQIKDEANAPDADDDDEDLPPSVPQPPPTLEELTERAREIFDREGCVEIGLGTVGSCNPQPVQAVDAGAFALSALASTPIPAPEVHMAPETNLPVIVNLDTWLWITSGWQTFSATASTGLSTITVTAEPVAVVWQMGEGTTRCDDAGKPWVKGAAEGSSDCTFTYAMPHESQAVSAWVEYEASWTCAGPCSDASGTVGLVQSEPWEGQLEVRERQTVVTR